MSYDLPSQALGPSSSPIFTALTLTSGPLAIGTAAFAAANSHTLALGPTATARSYNSFTDASNGEWAYMGDWGVTSNVATYGTDKNGTGSTRNLQFVVGGADKLDFGITNANIWTSSTAIAFGITPASAAGSIWADGATLVLQSESSGFRIVNSTNSANNITVDNVGNTVVSGSLAMPSTLIITSMPTSDPHVVGQLWNSSGTVHISAG